MKSSVPVYEHTQRATLVLAALGAAAAVLGWMGWSRYGGHWLPSLVLAFVVLTMLLFPALTVRVTEEEVALAFGIGLVRRRFRMGDILDARAVTNPWYYGWGIRSIPHGWLYNVAGFQAVELDLAGGRMARIGTDEPERLLAAIRSTRSRTAG